MNRADFIPFEDPDFATTLREVMHDTETTESLVGQAVESDVVLDAVEAMARQHDTIREGTGDDALTLRTLLLIAFVQGYRTGATSPV